MNHISLFVLYKTIVSDLIRNNHSKGFCELRWKETNVSCKITKNIWFSFAGTI